MFKMIPKKIKKVDNLCSKFTINPPKRHTCNVNKHDKNFLLSPITIAEATGGSSALIWSSMGTGAIFSPPAVIIISRGKKGKYTLLSVSKSNWRAEITFNWIYPANIYLFKVNNRNTGKKCEYKNVIDVALVFLLLTLNRFHTFSGVTIVNLEQVIRSWLHVSLSRWF